MTLVFFHDRSMRSRVARRARLRCASLLLLSMLLTGCATGPNANPNDPLEPLNRVIFRANDKLDEYVATPVAKGYRAVAPQPLQTAVNNFFGNLADVGNTLNSLLQGKGVAAMESLMRVAINTVFGLGGLLDIATPAGLHKHSQDFGLTLGTWGVPSGPYLVLPLFGPRSIRDGMGLYVDFQLDPLTYMRPAVRNSLYGLQFVNVRSNMLGATDLLSQAALDRYSFVRDAYQQQRLYLIQEGKGKTKLPEYEDFGDPDEGASKQGPEQNETSPVKLPASDGSALKPSLPEAPEAGAPDRRAMHGDASGSGYESLPLQGSTAKSGTPSIQPLSEGDENSPEVAPK